MPNEDAFDEAFSEAAPAADDATPSVAEEQPETPSEGTEAGAQAPVEPQPGEQLAAPQEPEPQPETPAQPDPEQFKGYLDEREKRQKFEAEAENLRREIQQLRQQTQKTEPETPPEFDLGDPESRFQYMEQQAQQAMFQQTVQQSRFHAGREFGEEVVSEAEVWARGQPQHIQVHLSQHPSPFHAAIEAMKKDKATQALSEHGYDIEKLIAARTQQAQATPQPTAPPQNPPPAMPPKVLNSGGRDTGIAPPTGDVFDEVFSR